MNQFIDLIGSLGFYALPLSVGLPLSRLIFRQTNIVFSYCLGSLIIYALYAICNGFELPFEIIKYLFAIIFGIYLVLFCFNFRKIVSSIQTKLTFKSDYLPLTLIFLISSILYFYIWKGNTPYPLALNWDIYEHITVAHNITSGQFSFLPSKISDTFTFDGYSTLFHTLLSLPELLFNSSLLGSYWWLEYWHYLLSSIAVYFGVYIILKNKKVAFFASIINALIFESNIPYTTLFLIPQTLVGLVAFGGFIAIVNQLKDGNNKLRTLIQLITICTFLLLTHFIVGLAAVGILLATYVLFLSKNRLAEFMPLLLGLSLVFLVISIAGATLGNIVLTNREEAAHYTLSFTTKVQLLFNWFGLLLPLLLPFGAYNLYKRYGLSSKLALIFAVSTFALAIFPLSYFLKFFVLAHYFILLVFAGGLSFIFKGFGKTPSLILGTWICLAFGTVFYFNQQAYKQMNYFDGNYTHISPKEIGAGLWLKEQYGKDPGALLISDPSTQYVLEAASQINTQGGAYMGISMRSLLSKAGTFNNPQEAYNLFSSVKKSRKGSGQFSRVLFVASGRYFAWQALTDTQRASFFYNIWSPRKLDSNDVAKINQLIQNPGFKVVFQNDELAIIEIL